MGSKIGSYLMDSDKKLKKLIKKIAKNHKESTGFRYPGEHDNGERFNDYAVEWFNEILSGKIHPIGAREVFEGLSNWYLDNTQYQILAQKNETKATEYFKRSAAYGYLAVYISKVNFHCKNTVSQEVFLIDDATDYMSRCLLCGWEQEYSNIGDWLIESINFGHQKKGESGYYYQIIGIGTDDILNGWFLLDLYCLVYNKTYNKKNAAYPENLLFYKDVLENWDTKDLAEVDKLVYVMADYHLIQTQQEKSDAEYFTFSHDRLWLFPYEILTWLKLRELNGLKNPKKYSHPLMNTPVAEFFLSLETPFEKPKNLPYARELFENFKTQLCPDIEIPDWV
jgi:hypothetical protein